MKSFGILGNGEVGSSLRKVYEMAGLTDVVVRDPSQDLNGSLSDCDVVNVCIPYRDHQEFVEVLSDLRLKQECALIIQSTVAVGCTDRVQAAFPELICAHSPVRGVHPNLAEGLLAFEKYVGVSDESYKREAVAESLAQHVKSLGMNPVLCRAKESEMAKLVSTTLYGVNIAAITDVSNLCSRNGVDFDKVFTQWQVGYNAGYASLGKPNVCRPVLTPIPRNEEGEQIIGGHCVLPNCVILRKSTGESYLSELVLRYSDTTSRVHHTLG